MSLERKIMRKKLKAARGNHTTPFNIIWRRFQIKKYGYKKAFALSLIGKLGKRLTNQRKIAAYK